MPNMTQPKLWVLVANAAQALVAVPESHAGRFRTLFRFEPTAHLRDHRSADQQRHVALIAHRLDQGAQGGEFDQLVVVAPGHVLHDLKAALGKPASGRLVDTATQDLAGFADHELSAHLAKWWLAPAEPA